MPVVLIFAFAASLGVHALALFAPDVDLSFAGEPPALVAELRTLPAPPPPPAPAAKPETKVMPANRRPLRRKATAAVAPRRPLDSPTIVAAAAVAALPAPEPGDQSPQDAKAAPATAPAAVAGTPAVSGTPAVVASALSARGRIRYRVDRGDQGFQIGFSIHDWEVVDGAYRITAVTETSGLIGFFRPLRFEVESRGQLTTAGLVPEHVATRQKGRDTDETAELDWGRMELRVGTRPVQTLRPGTQDLLSFPYQLGLLPDLRSGSSLPIITGKKYADHRVEVVGDEEIDVPAGTFRCVHLRVPGVATTELWLAYERALLPVKIQHRDRKGDLYVQVATAIELSQEPR
ncbi:MAG: DUF3108 domain-containing protein [Candidatus Accumulibacter sp.]|uniref:DUF3108 domain-containing protein n=1 Tax=Candidatus Accumulibacter affinis TaxID=2954384 RepID=A0A935THA3_9PROT|nr:DUF3108 domain-containing protein [Candidatus Accumulibacter affinis]